MHVNKNGDIELDIVDVYDFNEGEPNEKVRVGRDRQERGEIKPYFSINDIIFSTFINVQIMLK